jgi:hypothetical protein
MEEKMIDEALHAKPETHRAGQCDLVEWTALREWTQEEVFHQKSCDTKRTFHRVSPLDQVYKWYRTPLDVINIFSVRCITHVLEQVHHRVGWPRWSRGCATCCKHPLDLQLSLLTGLHFWSCE